MDNANQSVSNQLKSPKQSQLRLVLIWQYGIIIDMATGIDIQIDILGIVRNSKTVRLFLIEANKRFRTALSIVS